MHVLHERPPFWAVLTDDIGATIMIGIFIGPLIYVFVDNTPFASIVITVIACYICYTWGHIKGTEGERAKHPLRYIVKEGKPQDEVDEEYNITGGK